MDYRERKRLKDEINRGVPNTGIYKVDPDGLERENRSPIVIGGGIGLGISGPLGIGYMRSEGFWRSSPLGLFPDDYILVALGIMAGGALIGGALGWLYIRAVPTRRKRPKDAPP